MEPGQHCWRRFSTVKQLAALRPASPILLSSCCIAAHRCNWQALSWTLLHLSTSSGRFGSCRTFTTRYRQMQRSGSNNASSRVAHNMELRAGVKPGLSTAPLLMVARRRTS